MDEIKSNLTYPKYSKWTLDSIKKVTLTYLLEEKVLHTFSLFGLQTRTFSANEMLDRYLAPTTDDGITKQINFIISSFMHRRNFFEEEKRNTEYINKVAQILEYDNLFIFTNGIDGSPEIYGKAVEESYDDFRDRVNNTIFMQNPWMFAINKPVLPDSQNIQNNTQKATSETIEKKESAETELKIVLITDTNIKGQSFLKEVKVNNHESERVKPASNWNKIYKLKNERVLKYESITQLSNEFKSLTNKSGYFAKYHIKQEVIKKLLNENAKNLTITLTPYGENSIIIQ